MPMPAKDLTGRQFGYLTVLRRSGTTEGTLAKRATWAVRCVCGAEFDAIGSNLTSANRGAKKSCGCRRREMLLDAWGSHGMTAHPAWNTWVAMRSRCRNQKDKDWPNWGGRGISVCERWQQFENFWADMGPTWMPGLTIERQNNSGNYEPGNCIWAGYMVQANNRRGNVHLDTPQGRMTIAQAARAYGVKPVTLRQRILLGWPPERALVPPGFSIS